MHLVGNTNSGLQVAPLTPQQAWQRGRVLDAMLPSPLTLPRGVVRLSHAERNAQDDARMLATARRLNPSQGEHGG